MKNTSDPTRQRSTGQIRSSMATSMQKYWRRMRVLGGGHMASQLISKEVLLSCSGVVTTVTNQPITANTYIRHHESRNALPATSNTLTKYSVALRKSHHNSAQWHPFEKIRMSVSPCSALSFDLQWIFHDNICFPDRQRAFKALLIYLEDRLEDNIGSRQSVRRRMLDAYNKHTNALSY